MVWFIFLLLVADVKQVMLDLHSVAALASFTPAHFMKPFLCVCPWICLSSALLCSLTIKCCNYAAANWLLVTCWQLFFIYLFYSADNLIRSQSLFCINSDWGHCLPDSILVPTVIIVCWWELLSNVVNSSFVRKEVNVEKRYATLGLVGTGISRRVPISPNDPWCDDCLSCRPRDMIDWVDIFTGNELIQI